jgi:hypothetical protein
MRTCGRRIWYLALAVLPLACEPRPAPSTDTGARAAVEEFYAALVAEDWPRAYSALHPDSRTRRDADTFRRQAQTYRQHLGFEPRELRVRSCEEHADEAVAHVVISGEVGTVRHGSYKDAVTLRRGASGWGVVLPSRFGQIR